MSEPVRGRYLRFWRRATHTRLIVEGRSNRISTQRRVSLHVLDGCSTLAIRSSNPEEEHPAPMPLSLTRAAANDTLWETCVTRFLDELGGHTGPRDFPSHLWIAHRAQRDSLYSVAAERGLPGWLAPPISFLSELRERFRIEERPIGILTGRLLVARIARERQNLLDLSMAPGREGPARSHMLDSVFSELLPEGVAPERLRETLAEIGGDEFGSRRNAWVADTYEAFLAELESRDRFDPRSIHAMVADRVEAGSLREAIGGAHRLHVYGITSLRGRQRLLSSLATQNDVEVVVYLPQEDEPSEWDDLVPEAAVEGAKRASLDTAPPDAPHVTVQPAPDAPREVAWVARQVKHLLAAGDVEPHEIAIVARSGRRDTRLVHRALRAAGIPGTARLRTRLAEVPCLKALLALFNAEAVGWDYRSLRPVLASPYFGTGIDLRSIDYVATTRRVAGLVEWVEALSRMRASLDAEQQRRRLARSGVYADRLDEDVPRLQEFAGVAEGLATERSEQEWIDCTLEILDGGWFGFRRRVCGVASDRFDVVRLDQRGVRALEALLLEWQMLVETADSFGATEWSTRLRRLLEANELALSTPLQAGVQVLEAHEAALTPFRHTFLVHANDGEFPRSARPGGVFSDAERRRLRELGLPLSDRDQAVRRERSLWRAVTAGDQVTVTYRTTDSNGVPRLPSLMVPDHDPATELPRTVETPPEGADHPRDAVEPVNEPEQRRIEVWRLARTRGGGDLSPFSSSGPKHLRHALLSAFAEELRAGRLDDVVKRGRDLIGAAAEEPDLPMPESVFGLERPISEQPHPWNGELRDPVVLERLATQFDDEYVWSATQLQTYGIRPFDFFLERVLYLGETEEAEEETSALTFGSVAHSILERFYGELGEAVPECLDEETERLLKRVTEAVFSEYETNLDEWLGLRTLWRVSRGRIQEEVRDFLTGELAYLAQRREAPVLIEHAFGFDSGEPPVRLEGDDVRGRPARLLLRGRIDRVDRHGTGNNAWLRVVDYKSGGTPSPGGYDDGALLQTALYMQAVEQLDREEVRSGVFRSIGMKSWNRAELKRERLGSVLEFALSIPSRIRAGLFEAVQAGSTPIAPWQPDRSLTRTEARIGAGSRFDVVHGERIDDA